MRVFFLSLLVNSMACCNQYPRPCGYGSCCPPISPYPCPCPPPIIVPVSVGPTSVFQAQASATTATVISTIAAAIVPYNTIRTGNTDGAFSIFTSTYTAPKAGLYQFDIALQAATTAAAAAVAQTVTVNLVVDGVITNTQSRLTAAALGSVTGINFSSIVSLNQGSQVQVTWLSPTTAGAVALVTAVYPTAGASWFQGKSLF